jgi:hypothetical protein
MQGKGISIGQVYWTTRPGRIGGWYFTQESPLLLLQRATMIENQFRFG